MVGVVLLGSTCTAQKPKSDNGTDCSPKRAIALHANSLTKKEKKSTCCASRLFRDATAEEVVAAFSLLVFSNSNDNMTPAVPLWAGI